MGCAFGNCRINVVVPVVQEARDVSVSVGIARDRGYTPPSINDDVPMANEQTRTSRTSSGRSWRLRSEARASGVVISPRTNHNPFHLNRTSVLDSPSYYINLYYSITGSVELIDGRVVLCDKWSGTLIMLSAGLAFDHRLRLRGDPHNVTIVQGRNDMVAVTIPEQDMIQFIEITNGQLVDSGRSVVTNPNCRGIEYIDNKLIYTSENDVIVDNTSIKEFDFDHPWSLMADRERKRLYVSCNGLGSNGEVVIVDWSRGRTNDKLRLHVVSNMKMSSPIYCTKSNDDFLYVCSVSGRFPGSIHRVSATGDYCGPVVMSEALQMQHMQFLTRRGCFLMSEHRKDRLTLCEVK